jgi:hypothetical protein
MVKEIHAGLRHMVVDILLDGISRGIFRSDIARDAEKIANNLLAYLDGICLHSMASDQFFNLNVQIDYYIKNLIVAIQSESAAEYSEYSL